MGPHVRQRRLGILSLEESESVSLRRSWRGARTDALPLSLCCTAIVPLPGAVVGPGRDGDEAQERQACRLHERA